MDAQMIPEAWIRAHVEPTGPIEVVHDRPWATVLRVPTASGPVWFKACAPHIAFEPRLTAQLSRRWPDHVTRVLAYDEARAWLLLADAGVSIGRSDASRAQLLAILPAYAELQRGEAAFAQDHVDHGVTDLRLAELPRRYGDLVVQRELPIDANELSRLRGFADQLGELCRELADAGIPETVQHDDLHHNNIHVRDSRWHLLDWGDASIAHPFMSLVVPYKFLDRDGLPPSDPWFARMRDAYLEPWGRGLADTFELAIRIGWFAHAIGWDRQRRTLPADWRARIDDDFATILRCAVAIATRSRTRT